MKTHNALPLRITAMNYGIGRSGRYSGLKPLASVRPVTDVVRTEEGGGERYQGVLGGFDTAFAMAAVRSAVQNGF
jgi:hypothetical protein